MTEAELLETPINSIVEIQWGNQLITGTIIDIFNEVGKPVEAYVYVRQFWSCSWMYAQLLTLKSKPKEPDMRAIKVAVDTIKRELDL